MHQETEHEVRVQVFRDGEPVSPSFQGYGVKPHNEAFGWLLRHQGQSVDWAIKYEGYEFRTETIVHRLGQA
jgi:hypothetical protein